MIKFTEHYGAFEINNDYIEEQMTPKSDDTMPERIWAWEPDDRYKAMGFPFIASRDHLMNTVEYTLTSSITAQLEAAEKMAEALATQLDLSERRKDFGEFYLEGKTALSQYKTAKGEKL